MPSAKTQAKPGDYTGRQRAELAAKAASEQAARAEEITLISAAEAKRLSNEVVDYTSGPTPVIEYVEQPVDYSSGPVVVNDEVIDLTHVADEPVAPLEVELVGASLVNDIVVIQVVEDIEQMTFGAGNLYDFKVDRKYKVPREIADHLKDKGYVYHGY